jgi:hypothetical protein
LSQKKVSDIVFQRGGRPNDVLDILTKKFYESYDLLNVRITNLRGANHCTNNMVFARQHAKRFRGLAYVNQEAPGFSIGYGLIVG